MWGPYLSERQWGTVREDYSSDGNAWEYVSHDDARSRAYRWGEDGLAGFSDHDCQICLALALWNGQDPILKERLFGLTNSQGNHGEDVKECYYYLDATPTHCYNKMLYKYPQQAFPYEQLVAGNRSRGYHDPEFELLDTGVFDGDRYFDVFIEYAKADPEDILMRITVVNRGPEPATIHVLPQIWFRNTWSWDHGAARPELEWAGQGRILLQHTRLGNYHFSAGEGAELLFTGNETNSRRLFDAKTGPVYTKDAIHEAIVRGNPSAVNPERRGTKAAAHLILDIPAGEERVVRARLHQSGLGSEFDGFDPLVAARRREADEFFESVHARITDPELRRVQRQALAGMLWSKQYYFYDVDRWLKGDPPQPPPPDERCSVRNGDWRHLNNAEVISMPDKWEYPWYAAWDLAFHCLPLALVDAEFAKRQLDLMTREWYMHPNGQLPAYEWEFSDVNPPVHAWATWRVFQIDRKQRGDQGDLPFLERVFHKLLLNFTWWVNRKDVEGRNIFQGGFLGLDNIGVFDRSKPLPTGGYINQADGTSWMAMYSLNLLRIAIELAQHNIVYEDIATKFFEHFLQIAHAMTDMGGQGIGLWDEQDQFYYDELNLPDGHIIPLRVRSMVGLIPLFAVETLEPDQLANLPGFTKRLEWTMRNRPELCALVSRWQDSGRGERRLLSLLRGSRMKKLLKRMLDPEEFLSDYGVRGLSKAHERNPYVFHVNGEELQVRYLPAESDSWMFGGNSNWRGPVWFPLNYLIIESLQKFHHYYGDDFKIECPTGSGNLVTINEAADELSRRLMRIFLPDEGGRRPVFRQHEKMASDPHFRENLLFYEYFHGDNGRGVGASHQTGWTGLVAKLIDRSGW